MSKRVTVEQLKEFLDAFNRHDLGTHVSGKSIEVRGVDLLEFMHGKITRKDSFWKIVE